MSDEDREDDIAAHNEQLRNVRLFRSVSELRGTCYMELLPGKYRGQCWMPGSVFLTDEVFGFIEPFVHRHVPEYDHYAFTEIAKPAWSSIISDVHRTAERLRAARAPGDLPELGYIFETTRECLEADFGPNCAALAHVMSELTEWLVDALEQNDFVTVLGL